MSQLNPLLPARIPSSRFPCDVLKWMKHNMVENAKPRTALELMKCHKYFKPEEFPYFVVKGIANFADGNGYYVYTLRGDRLIYKELETNMAKFWITEYLFLYHVPNLVTRLLRKIAVCDVEILELLHQKLSFGNFLNLTSSGNVKKLFLHDTTITSENGGNLVSLNTILQCVPNVENFYYFYRLTPIFSSDSSIDMLENCDSSKIKRIELHICFFSDFKFFLTFMNQNPHIQYTLKFISKYPCGTFSKSETRTLQNYVQQVINTGSHPPPFIVFPGQTQAQYNALDLLLRNYYAQKKD